MGIHRKSLTIRPYPKVVPRSVSNTLRKPRASHLLYGMNRIFGGNKLWFLHIHADISGDSRIGRGDQKIGLASQKRRYLQDGTHFGARGRLSRLVDVRGCGQAGGVL